ncbi:hypothetical protein EV177_009237 [Coemansia sp. RSA 1804]|nr:hypothetical protein EV177_009237 [Coemansia sp. RSA 1804]
MKDEGSTGEDSTLPRSSKSSSSSPSPDNANHRCFNAREWTLYAADWITVIVVTAVSQLILIPWPLSHSFVLSDPEIQQEHHNDKKNIDRISIVLSTTIPTVIIMVWLGWFSRPLGEMHRTILGLAMALSFCALFTSIFRQIGNILSTDFISLCRPTQQAFINSIRLGRPITIDDCTNRNLKGGTHEYPAPSITISSCAAGYLSLFASVQLGLRLHPRVMRRLRQTMTVRQLQNSLHGQTLISFICLLPIGASMAFPAVEGRYHGGGHGWSYAFSIILGYIFALWAHMLYCGHLSTALVLGT